eukprot:COSAG01_NODE_5028_length_4537_cov_4.829428_2_plen_210_part_00
MAAGGGTLTAAAQPQQPPLPPTPSTAGGGIKSTVLDGWRAFRSALGLHTKEFGELVSLVDGTHLWRCLTLPCSGAASSRSFHEFVGLLGLSNSVNWVLFYLYIWGYATSSLKFDWALVLVPPWNPLSATMIMYWLFEKAGHGAGHRIPFIMPRHPHPSSQPRSVGSRPRFKDKIACVQVGRQSSVASASRRPSMARCSRCTLPSTFVGS